MKIAKIISKSSSVVALALVASTLALTQSASAYQYAVNLYGCNGNSHMGAAGGGWVDDKLPGYFFIADTCKDGHSSVLIYEVGGKRHELWDHNGASSNTINRTVRLAHGTKIKMKACIGEYIPKIASGTLIKCSSVKTISVK